MITLREYDAARNVATYTVDTEAEIAKLPNLVTGDDINGLGPVAMGSSVICLENMTLYMLDGNNEYVAFGSGNGSGGGGGSTEIKIPRFDIRKLWDNHLDYDRYNFVLDEVAGSYDCFVEIPNDGKDYYIVLSYLETWSSGESVGDVSLVSDLKKEFWPDTLTVYEVDGPVPSYDADYCSIYDKWSYDMIKSFDDDVSLDNLICSETVPVKDTVVMCKKNKSYICNYDPTTFRTGDPEKDEYIEFWIEDLAEKLVCFVVPAVYDTYTVSGGGGGGGGTPNAVQYVPQTLTDAQKLQARTNIGAPSSVDELSDVDISSIANNDVLKYNESTEKWENGQVTNPITVGSAPLTPGISTLDPGTIYIWYEDTV